MNIKELQEQVGETNADHVALASRKMLWNEGVLANRPEKVKDLDLFLAQRRWDVGRLVVELAAFCKAADLDLEECVGEALGESPLVLYEREHCYRR